MNQTNGALTELRDKDIHLAPVKPAELPGSFGSPLSFGELAAVGQSIGPRFIATDPASGKQYEVRALCDRGLEFARKIIPKWDTI